MSKDITFFSIIKRIVINREYEDIPILACIEIILLCIFFFGIIPFSVGYILNFFYDYEGILLMYCLGFMTIIITTMIIGYIHLCYIIVLSFVRAYKYPIEKNILIDYLYHSHFLLVQGIQYKEPILENISFNLEYEKTLEGEDKEKLSEQSMQAFGLAIGSLVLWIFKIMIFLGYILRYILFGFTEFLFWKSLGYGILIFLSILLLCLLCEIGYQIHKLYKNTKTKMIEEVEKFRV